MNEEKFQKLLNAEPPLSIKIDWVPSPLLLSEEGFSCGFGLLKSRYRWEKVSAFIVTHMFFLFPMVSFDDGRRGILSFLCRLLNNGYNSNITCKVSFDPDFTHAQLAQLMNHWRERAITNNSN